MTARTAGIVWVALLAGCAARGGDPADEITQASAAQTADGGPDGDDSSAAGDSTLGDAGPAADAGDDATLPGDATADATSGDGSSAGDAPADQATADGPVGDASPDAGAHAAKFPVKNIVFMIKENRTFDTYFGRFPGARGATTGGTCDGGTAPLRRLLDRQSGDIDHSWSAAAAAYNDGGMNCFDTLGTP